MTPDLPDPDLSDTDFSNTELPDTELRCSAKGCAAGARWQLLWNNPRIHPAERRKTWLACEDHRTSLGDFLGARGFLREVEPVPDAGSAPGV